MIFQMTVKLKMRYNIIEEFNYICYCIIQLRKFRVEHARFTLLCNNLMRDNDGSSRAISEHG